jgi:hypothetical protein
MRFTGIGKGSSKSASKMQPLAGGYHSQTFDDPWTEDRAMQFGSIFFIDPCESLHES